MPHLNLNISIRREDFIFRTDCKLGKIKKRFERFESVIICQYDLNLQVDYTSITDFIAKYKSLEYIFHAE